MSPHYMWNTELDPFLTPRSGLLDSLCAAWDTEVQKGAGHFRIGPSLTRADVQALPVLLQPLDPLLQLPKQCVIQQQLLTLGGGKPLISQGNC